VKGHHFSQEEKSEGDPSKEIGEKRTAGRRSNIKEKKLITKGSRKKGLWREKNIKFPKQTALSMVGGEHRGNYGDGGSDLVKKERTLTGKRTGNEQKKKSPAEHRKGRGGCSR